MAPGKPMATTSYFHPRASFFTIDTIRAGVSVRPEGALRTSRSPVTSTLTLEPPTSTTSTRGRFGMARLPGDRDGLPEAREAVNEEPESDRAHHQELHPHRAEAAAAVDDHLREADEMPRREEIRHVLQPPRLALHGRTPSRQEHQDDDDEDDEQRELRHRPR